MLSYAHRQPCHCVSCENVRANAYAGPGLYRAIGTVDHPNRSGTTCWTLDRFAWGAHVPPRELVWVERELRAGEPGEHVDGVVIWLLEDGANFTQASRLCTSKKWLEPA